MQGAVDDGGGADAGDVQREKVQRSNKWPNFHSKFPPVSKLLVDPTLIPS